MTGKGSMKGDVGDYFKKKKEEKKQRKEEKGKAPSTETAESPVEEPRTDSE